MINKVVPTDTNEQAFLNRLNPAIDVIPISINRAGKILTLGLEGGGSFAATLLSAPNAISSGIALTKGANNLTFNMSAGGYSILDIDYSAIATIIELVAGDPFKDRIDLIVANTAGDIIRKTGVTGVPPSPPALLSTEVLIATILVKANATTGSAGDIFIALSNFQAQDSTFILSEDLGTPIEPVGATTLGSLTDVDLTGLTTNQVIKYNSITLKWEVVDFSFDALIDTEITAPSAGEFLIYKVGTGWINTANLINGGVVVNNSIISPNLSANAGDYNPAGLSTCYGIYVNSTGGGSNDISGIEAQEAGREIVILNAGSTNIKLQNNNSSSLPINRFLMKGDLTLEPNEALKLFYDGNSSRWRAINIF
jgi:hypothetical protein